MKPEQFIREKGLDKCGDEFEQHFLSLPFSNSEAAQKCLDACDFDVKQNAFIPNAKWFNNNDVDEGVIYCCMLNTAYMSFLKQQAKVDELQTLYTQQGINMLKLQKRVDAVIIEIENMYLSGAIGFDTVKKLEQALKGDQYDEHRKKAEEAISKGASLTNHRIEL